MQMLALAAFLFLQVGRAPQLADGVIEGQIQSMDGTPAVGLRVTALSLSDSKGTSAKTIAGFSDTDNSGRFRLRDVAAGKYYIMAGALDVASYYPGVRTEKKARIVMVGAGTTASGIDFKLARPAGLRVTGIVKGFPQGVPPGLIRVLLTSGGNRPFRITQSVPIQPDGTFEFAKVFPGEYFAQLTATAMLSTTVQIHVKEKDVHIAMKSSLFVGRVSVDDGSPLPASSLTAGVAPGTQEPLSLVQLLCRRTGPASGKQPIGPFQAGATARADGYFAFEATAGDYEIMAQQLPMGYYFKEVRQNRETSRFDVTLTTTPQASDPKGVTLSGRIVGLNLGTVEPTVMRIQMVNRGGFPGTPQRVAEIPIRADGTFAVRGVPPGPISLNLMPIGNSPLQMRIDVADGISTWTSLSSAVPRRP